MTRATDSDFILIATQPVPRAAHNHAELIREMEAVGDQPTAFSRISVDKLTTLDGCGRLSIQIVSGAGAASEEIA